MNSTGARELELDPEPDHTATNQPTGKEGEGGKGVTWREILDLLLLAPGHCSECVKKKRRRGTLLDPSFLTYL